MPRTLKPEQLDILRTQYLAGATCNAAAAEARVAHTTAARKFGDFKHAGLVRGTVVRKRWARSRPERPWLRKYPRGWGLPRYTGPAWIGKAIDTESRI